MDQLVLIGVLDESSVSATEETVSAGFEFEGYVVYQLPSASSPLSEAVKVATYDKVNLIQNILDPSIDPITGLVVDAAKQTGTDAGVQRYFSTDYDEVRGRPMSNGVTYHFAVTAYSYLADNEGSPFKTLESGETRVAVTPRSLNPGETVHSEMSSAIDITHNGTANATINVSVINPSELKDESYKVTFDTQVYARDINGTWNKVVSRSANSVADATDCAASTITATAYASASLGTIDLVLDFTLSCADGAWIDGIQMTFPDGFASKVNSYGVTGIGNICSYGTDSGQNCDNLDGTWTGDVLLYGDDDRTGFGAFESSNTFTINYTPSDAGTWDLPLAVDYVIYDDHYTDVNSDGVGTATVSFSNFEEKTEYHWNLSTTSGTVLLEDQTFIGGADLYGGMSVDNQSGLHYNSAAAVTVNGFHLNVEGGYDSPVDYFEFVETPDAAAAALYGESIYDVGSYIRYGWALTSKATDTYGNGLTSVDFLQRDIEVRWVGEFVDEPITTDAGVVYYTADTNLPHSYAWISGSRLSHLADHPDPANPGDGSSFRVAVPFEVWDMEDPSGPRQIDIDIYDRKQSFNSGDTVYVFNPFDRMYTHFMMADYQEDGEYVDGPTGTPTDFLTWNIVWWEAQFNQGDVVRFNYANPIQPGVDEFVFSTMASETVASNDVSEVSVYPNPYYGTHELESSRADKYVSFNHLPAEAKIDIYSLGGVFVRSIHKHDASQFAQWDLKNQYGYPVASGLYISFAKKLSDNTSVGLTANYVRESFGRVSASGVAYDLGVQYKGLLGREGLDVGFALKNFGSPVKYDGPGLGVFAEPSDADRPSEYYKLDAAAFDLPFTFDMGITYNIAGVDLGATYTSNYYSTDELKLSAGYKFEGLGSVGVGFQTSGAAQELEHHGDDHDHDHGDDDWYTNPSDGVSFGASLDMSRFVGMNMSVDYSMLPMGDFGTNSVLALRFAF